MKNYFAYGSCVNTNSFIDTLLKNGGKDFEILGVGRLENYKLAFTRKKNDRTGALDIIPSNGDYVLGLVYKLDVCSIRAIDAREGYPYCYDKFNVNVTLNNENITVFTYCVVDKHMDEVKPSIKYYETVLNGMAEYLPKEYIKNYFIDHCYNKFGMEKREIPKIETDCVHERADFKKDNSEFFMLIEVMYKYLGDENSKVEEMNPTPEMYRLLTKATYLAARGKLDLGHLVTRGIYNRLSDEFERLSGVMCPKV
jgi:hypothetical protein